MNRAKRSIAKKLVSIVVIGIVFFNVVAFNHARAMLVFTDGGSRTVKPEELGFGEKLLVLIKGVNIPKPKNYATPEEYGLLYETHHVTVSDDITLEGWLIPHESPKGHVLMFHGYAAAKSTILAEASAFHELGYSVFMVDFRGSGGSSLAETSVGYYEADDVAVTAQFVEENFGWEDVIVYGQSMGSVAILKAVHDGKINPTKIILESVFDRTLSTVDNRFDSMGVPSFPSSHVLVFWGSVIGGFNAFSHNPVDYARTVDCPILFMHGESDPRATLAQGTNVYEQVQSEKHLIVFNGAVHESLYKSNPQQWTAEVIEFLDDPSD